MTSCSAGWRRCCGSPDGWSHNAYLAELDYGKEKMLRYGRSRPTDGVSEPAAEYSIGDARPRSPPVHGCPLPKLDLLLRVDLIRWPVETPALHSAHLMVDCADL